MDYEKENNIAHFKLYKLRKDNNFTCAQMADMLSISTAFYWQIESGDRRLFYEMAIQIAKIFNCKPDDIFYDDFN